MEITKISSKGQIVIPSKIREALEMKEGSVLALDMVKGSIIMKKIDVDFDLIEQFKEGLEDLKKGRIKRVA